MQRTLLFLITLWLISSTGQAQTVPNLDTYPDCGFTEIVGVEGLRFGAVVYNFENGLGCVENLDETFNAASVPKIFVAGAYYDQFVNSAIGSTRLEFTRDYWMGGRNDCLEEDDIGTVYSGEELVDFMINCSDNAATWMLMDSIGWFRVDNYVQSLGIEGIGQVIPYAEVDRRKLEFLDEAWGNVPLAIASRFYRSGITTGLQQYFNPIPDRPRRPISTEINKQYFETYATNTLTPRALAQYIFKLREDVQFGGLDGIVASSIFDSMLYTQRQFSVQNLPGTTYIGSKNGFDRGLLAEANILFNDLQRRVPSGVVLVFAQYDDLTEGNSDLPGPFGGGLNDVFRTLSPQISETLYPSFRQPQVNNSLNISRIILNDQSTVQSCWNEYFRSGFAESAVGTLNNCFRNVSSRITFPVDENMALGVTLTGLNQSDNRFTFIFTAPDRRVFSYQTDRRNVDQAAIYWFHPIDMVGVWQVDIYQNLRHVYTQDVVVQR